MPEPRSAAGGRRHRDPRRADARADGGAGHLLRHDQRNRRADRAGGTQTLTEAETYTGATIVHPGATLILTGNGSLANSAGVIADGTFDIAGTRAGSLDSKPDRQRRGSPRRPDPARDGGTGPPSLVPSAAWAG